MSESDSLFPQTLISVFLNGMPADIELNAFADSKKLSIEYLIIKFGELFSSNSSDCIVT